MKARFALLCAALCGTAAGPAGAAALRISPVGFELATSQRATSLSVRDDGDAPMTVQVRVYRWTQKDGADVLEPTEALLASPPFASLDAGAEQTVRLIRPDGGEAPVGEQAFRLLVDELPPASGEPGGQVRLLMRHSVPVFVEPVRGDRPKVAWRASTTAGAIRLNALNGGGRRLRVANLKVLDAGGRTIAGRAGLVGYVLAGCTMNFSVPTVSVPGPGVVPVRVIADTDVGPIDAALAGRS